MLSHSRHGALMLPARRGARSCGSTKGLESFRHVGEYSFQKIKTSPSVI
jgi:hypothetical protein